MHDGGDALKAFAKGGKNTNHGNRTKINKENKDKNKKPAEASTEYAPKLWP